MKNILITGVGTGIGKATCINFLGKGFDVIGILRNDRHKPALINATKDLSGKLDLIYANLEESSFVEDVEKQLENLNVTEIFAVLNIAGVLDTTPWNEFDLTSMERVMRVNFANPSMLISKLYPLVVAGNGNILNVTSMSGYQGSVRFSGLSIYGASKAALGSMSESLACEFQNQSVHINALAIGSVNTQMLRDAFPEFEASISANEMAEYIFNFATHGYKFHNGKTIPVAVTNP